MNYDEENFKDRLKDTTQPLPKACFPLANFFAQSDLFPLSASILPRLGDVMKVIPTKEKGRFARQNSLVENRLLKKPVLYVEFWPHRMQLRQ